MEISYKREMKHNYLIIEPGEDMDGGYECRMMVSNPIEGLLRFRLKYLDSREYYYYEITSKQPLKRLLENRCISLFELRRLLIQIIQTLDRLEFFLLREDQLLLEPEFIYVTPESFDISLCLVPGKGKSFPEAMSGLLQYLLKKVNHQDKECVVLAYGLYQESLKDNYGMGDLLRLITMDEKKEQPVVAGQTDMKDQEVTYKEDTLIFRSEQNAPVIEKDSKPVPWRIIGFAITNMTGFIALYFILGIYRILPYGVVLLAGSGYIWFFKGKNQISPKKTNLEENEVKQKKELVHESWKLNLEEPEPEVKRQEEKSTNDTILLINLEQKENIRKLISMDGEEDILLSYFPFIIGKQEGVVDYVLNKETVSRLHARIDYDQEVYKVTDLNSTNGTTVNNQILEANETIILSPGDEIFVANVRFRFI